MFVRIPHHQPPLPQSIKSLLCSPQGLLIQYFDCKTPHPTSANVFHCDTPISPRAMFYFWFHATVLHFWWRVGGWRRARWHCGEEENCGFPLWCLLWDYSSATRGNPDSSVWEHTQVFALACLGRTLFQIVIQPAEHPFPLKWFLFYISVRCISFISFTSQSCSMLTWTPREWPVDGVKSQLARNQNHSFMTHLSTGYCPATEL